MRLANITWPQAEAYFKEHDMVLMGVGSIECHGKHMPLGTDTLIPDHLLEDIEKRTDVLICPTLPYGATDTLADFPGTINLGTDVLYDVMRSITDSLWQHGARKFVILNGHGGNTRTLHRLGMELQKRGGLMAVLNWWLMAWDMDPAWKGGHGGGEETAAILGIDPGLIDRTYVEEPLVLKNVSDELVATGFSSVVYKGVSVDIPRVTPTVTDNGWIGPDHPNTATEAWGKKMLQTSADYIVDFLGAFDRVKLD